MAFDRYAAIDENYNFPSQVNNALANSPAIKGVSWNKGAIPSGQDLNLLTTPGIYSINTTGVIGGLSNTPEDPKPGILEVTRTTNGINIQKWTYYGGRISQAVRSTISVSTGNWGPWVTAWDSKAETGGDAYSAHSIRQTMMMMALGGPINTNGLGNVSFRIDHGFSNFRDKLLPIFRAANIVPMITYNPRDWGRSENSGVTTSEVNGWVSNGWVEISNHGATHSNVTGEDNILDFVYGSLTEIESQLPAAAGKVWGFTIPGVSASDTPYDGFGSGNSPESWDTYMGRTILKYHAVGYGYLPGTNERILDGTIRDGLSHTTLDSASVSAARSRVNTAISTSRGIQFMIHPSLVDTTGYMTTANFSQLIDYIVSRRDANEVLTLSSYQMMVADSVGTATESEWIDITPSLSGITSGSVHIAKVLNTVWIDITDLVVDDPSVSFTQWDSVIPPGYRPTRMVDLAIKGRGATTSDGPVRVSASGQIVIYQPRDMVRGTVSYPVIKNS